MTNQPTKWAVDDATEPYDNDVHATFGAAPLSDTIDATLTDTVGTLAEKAYGHNSQGNREKIMRANGNLKGSIRVPR
jgi:hypothetical protein